MMIELVFGRVVLVIFDDEGNTIQPAVSSDIAMAMLAALLVRYPSAVVIEPEARTWTTQCREVHIRLPAGAKR